MNNLSLKVFYPAGGKSNSEIIISQIVDTKLEGVMVGLALSPLTGVEEQFVIYQFTYKNNMIDYRAVPAKCPHQGANISNDEVKADGNVYCSLHRRPICIYSEYNTAYAVINRDNNFYIAKST
ncbi:Rieske 2Fe-2S domain-containing protein [Thalassotalea profundi]|uniref:Rieske domain-containing protein n=1 Tax=Thalassotalea profundi TaxID=2036687 RepID=A0ABQ3IEI4_9GAMM|nr:Rieske 2Fe-2S domain-containing protein [Thalassotalea profundi]GHE79005.1 hypothetical protein GCM10011501_03660 [Thalassotalea profundi]